MRLDFDRLTSRSCAYSLPRALLLTLVLGAFAPLACGGGDSGGAAPATSACTSNADCAAGNYCDLSSALPGAQTRNTAALDMACLDSCLTGCDMGDDACAEGCITSCGGGDMSCNDLCSLLCEGDTACTTSCVPDCEADSGTGGTTGAGGSTASGGGPSGTTGGSSSGSVTGTCRPISQPSGSGGAVGTGGETASGGSPGSGGGASAGMVWAGTWNVRAVYTARCQWGSTGAPRDTSQNYMVSANITGENSSLTAVFANDTGYTMTGTGSDARMTISGQFPGRDHNNNAATTVRANNNVTIVVNDITDSNAASGTIEGNYETSGGIACTIQAGGSVELTR